MTTTATPLPRRKVKYRGYEMIVEDADRVAAGSFVTVGHWSYGQILDHLAKSLEASIDGLAFQRPWPVRFIARCFLKGHFLNKTLAAGHEFPGGNTSVVAPDASVTVETGLKSLKAACRRCTTERKRSFHPLLGNLERPEWDRFNLRHAELHMSFVVPVKEDNPSQPSESTKPATYSAR